MVLWNGDSKKINIYSLCNEGTKGLIAEEVSLHLEELTGRKHPYPSKIENFKKIKLPAIVLEIKKSLGDDSYNCFVDGNMIRIQGGNERGLFYGIVSFFEELGFRWYAPGKFGTVIPEKKKIELSDNWNIKGSPSIKWRGISICGGGFTKEGRHIFHFDYETALWMIRNKMNFKPIHNEEYKKFYPILKELLLEPLSFGHSYSFWLPPSEFEKYPEFFPLIAGKRQPEGQRCLSNPSFQNLIIERVIDFAEKYPDLKIISLSPNDGYKFCLCENCLSMDTEEDRIKGETNRRNHLFAYKIAEKFKEKYPDRFLSTLSYCNYLNPGDDIPYQKNLVISMCITKAQNYFVDDPKSPSNKIFLERFKKWKKKVGGIFCSFYHLSYGGTFPRPYEKQTIYMHRFLAKENVMGIKTEVLPGHFDLWKSAIFFMYIYARSLYDVSINEEELLMDFCRNFYGKVWKECMKIYKKNSSVINNYKKEIYYIEAKLLPSLYKEKDIKELKKIVTSIKKQFKQLPGIYKKRVILLINQVEELIKSRKAVIEAEKEAKILKCNYSSKEPNFNNFKNFKWTILRQRSNILPYSHFNGFTTLWTEDALWICFKLKEPCLKLEKRKNEEIENDVWVHSNVDCFISTEPEKNIYYQIAVNVHGDTYIAYCQGRNHDITYNLKPIVKINKKSNMWELILGIPFEKINLKKPLNNKKIKVSFNRGFGCYGIGIKILGGWPFGGSWHNIETMGELIFTKNEKGGKV